MNAMRHPWAPVRGEESMSRTPASDSRANAAGKFGTAMLDRVREEAKAPSK